MNFPYTLLTIGQDKSRDRLVLADDLESYYDREKDLDVLTSIWRYGEDAVTYFQRNITLKGFRGDMAIGYLPFDIDAHGEPLAVACQKCKKLLLELKQKGITNYKVSFSGSAGFHVIVPALYFNEFEPSVQLPQQLLSLAKHLTSADFDRAIYSHLRMFRLGGTKHPKSGLFKTQINEIDLDQPERIIESAKVYRDSFSAGLGHPIQALIELKNKAFSFVPEIPMFNFASKKNKNKTCISQLMKGVESGKRNAAACRVIQYFRDQGHTDEMSYEFFCTWNKFNNPPIEDTKVTFKDIWDGNYTYGCYDWLLDECCSKDCYLYEKKISNISTDKFFYTLEDAEVEYDKFIKEDRRYELGFSNRIDKLIRGIAPGDFICVLGRPGTYKSTLGQMIGTYISRRYGYFA
jgi:hypothetical protein